MYEYFLNSLVMFVVPLAPAYLLYKRLPSDTVVKGPFKGFTVALSGAFGGYFILVLIALGYLESVSLARKDTLEQWTVNGKLQLSDTTGYDDPSSADLVSIFYFPSQSKVQPLTEGRYMQFSVDVPVSINKDGDFTSLVQSLLIDAPNHKRSSFPFQAALKGETNVPGQTVLNVNGNNTRYSVDAARQQVTIIDPISLLK